MSSLGLFSIEYEFKPLHNTPQSCLHTWPKDMYYLFWGSWTQSINFTCLKFGWQYMDCKRLWSRSFCCCLLIWTPFHFTFYTHHILSLFCAVLHHSPRQWGWFMQPPSLLSRPSICWLYKTHQKCTQLHGCWKREEVFRKLTASGKL